MMQDPRIVVARNLAPANDERLRVGGVFNVSNLTPAIDPIANGLQFTIYGQSGDVLMSFFIPPGAQPDTQSPGWKVNRSGTRWGFKDRNSALVPIQRVSLTHKVNLAPGIFKVTVSAKMADFTSDPAELPLRLDVVLGGPPQAAAGQCAVGMFNSASGNRPKCEMRSGGDKVTCN
jgi:hypothetical protein